MIIVVEYIWEANVKIASRNYGMSAIKGTRLEIV